MKLYEYQGKLLFSEYSIPTPSGCLLSGLDDVKGCSLPSRNVVLKAQVPVGGRGRAGAIIKSGPEALAGDVKSLFGRHVKGFVVDRVLLEECLDVVSEWYLSVVFDRLSRSVLVLASPVGGVSIEDVAVGTPERVLRVRVDSVFGLMDFQVRRITKFLYGSVKGDVANTVSMIVRDLYRLFVDFDCLLAEINPLAVTNGGVVALDAKVVVDDNALYRQPRVSRMQEELGVDLIEVEAARSGMSYVSLEGDIGCVVNGAGLAMATMDLIKYFGGRPANFLDVRAGASSEQVVKATKLISLAGHLRCVFVNIFGGITRCDEIARGILESVDSISVPLIVRLTGTNAEEGLAMLEKGNIVTATSTEDGVEKAVVL